MGEVYVGYDETLKRKVALKAIRDERRLDAEAKARFLREARILSQLDHPGICRIHDLIEGDDSDFLVLELIAGKNLRQAMEEDDLETSFRLHIAERVTEALVAAHAQGVAHRDLKPENVMLTPDGGVKVLDFGIAYTVDPELSRTLDAAALDAAALDAESGSGAGRDPAIGEGPRREPGAAGEPAEPGRPLEPTVVWSGALPAVRSTAVTRPGSRGSDTASSATRPGTRRSGAASDFVETRRGTVLGTVGYMSPEQACGERVTTAGDMYSLGLLLQELFTGRPAYEPGLALLPMLRKAAAAETLPVGGIDPDLGSLITRLKSLAPAARPTAVETAERLRWIRGKPGRRLLRRLAAVLLAVLLLGGLKYTLDLRRERSRAVAARHEAEEVSEFLVGLFEVSDPRRARGDAITARELLDQGARKVAAELGGQPLSRARLMLTMGRVYRQLGLYEEARPLLEEAVEIRRERLGEDHLDTARAVDQLASLYHDQGDYQRAEPLFRRALEIRERILGSQHPHVAASLNNLAFLYRARGEDERAEPLLQRVLGIQRATLGGDHPDVASTLNNLGDLYRARGDHARAESSLRRAIEIQEEVLGADHPTLAVSLNNLAMLYHEEGDAARAEPLYLRTLAIAEKVLGAEHPNLATRLNNLAELFRVRGEYARAEPLYRRALAIQEGALEAAHPSTAVTLSNLADLLAAHGEARRAAPLYARAAAIQEQALGGDHPSLAVTLNHQADLLARGEEPERAEPLYRRALAIQERALGRGHPSVAITLADLAGLCTRQGRHPEAEALYERALAIAGREVAEQPDSRAARRRLAAVRLGLGTLLEATGDGERAAEQWSEAAAIMGPFTAGCEIVADLHVHALALLHLGRLGEARPMAEKLLAEGWSDPDFLALCREHGLVGGD